MMRENKGSLGSGTCADHSHYEKVTAMGVQKVHIEAQEDLIFRYNPLE